ncbi:MAG: hypothetical protein QM582_01005 [Micropruina sp.]|uniref:hypothetical protein n=1 Tax=Micropruina sp. TaxID=2737536 RepID=UPI0039E4E717
MKKFMLSCTAALLFLTACSAGPTSEVKGDNTGSTSTAPAASTPAKSESPAESAPETTDGTTATFKVTTSGKATITWGTTSGTSQDEVKKGSWTKKLKLDTFDAATVSVAAADFRKSVKVTCEILLNGVSKAKNSGKGKLASANCTTNTTE